MKTLYLIGITLMLVLTGCEPDADFITFTPVIVKKSQDSEQKILHAATYTISFSTSRFRVYNKNIVLPDTLGNVGDSISFTATNGMMYALPPILEK